ncbi:MAG: cation-translocating P-type ATPase C-terminal domain-containing protein, partial [Hoeflea sp.]|nr:cation-translocating P-type ATPase C-terminal domain-containing protein [Hoeflea sp.]
IGVLGTAITIATLGAFLLSLSWLKLDSAASVTVAFLTLALAQLWNVFNMRDPGTGLFDNDVTRNPYVWGALALCLGLIGLAIWLPALASLLGLPTPGMEGLALALAASLTPLALGQMWLALAGPGKA